MPDNKQTREIAIKRLQGMKANQKLPKRGGRVTSHNRTKKK